MATGDSENFRPASVSLDITITRAIDKAKTASFMLDRAIHFISSSIDSDSSFHLVSKTSCSFLISLYNLLKGAEDILNRPTKTGTMETGDSINLPPISYTLEDTGIIKALLRLNTASSRINKALHFIHPKIISSKHFRLSVNSLSFIESLHHEVEEAVNFLTKRLEESTAIKSPSRWRRLKSSCSRIKNAITQPFRSCFGRSANTQI